METSEIRWIGKELLKYAVSFIVLLVTFRLVNFSISQSLALIVIVGIGYEAYKTASARATRLALFSPYQVVIWPKFDELLLDFNLLTSAERATELHALWKKKDQKLISFTVLRDRSSGRDWLIYSNTDNYFFSDMQVEERIEAVVFEGDWISLRDPAAPDEGKYRRSPSFYFRLGSDGYELGLQVYDEWWAKTSYMNRPNVTTTPDHVCGWEKLSVATIPYEAFLLFNINTREKSWKALDGQLELRGWKRKRPDPDAQVEDPWIRIEHKYFRVQFRRI